MKSFPAFVATLAMVASLSACGETTTTDPVVDPPVVPPPVVPPAPVVAHVEPMYPLSMIGFIGTPVSPEPRVRVVDAYYKAISGARVVFEIVSGGGSIGTAESLTNEQGEAGVDFWKLGGAGVLNSLVARAGGHSVTFTAYGLNPDEAPVARYDLASVSGRAVPYTSGWNDLDAITGMEGTLELYPQIFVETFAFRYVFGDGRTFKQYVAGTYAKSADGIRLENLLTDATIRGDSLFVGPQKMPDEFVASSLYLKQKQ